MFFYRINAETEFEDTNASKNQERDFAASFRLAANELWIESGKKTRFVFVEARKGKAVVGAVLKEPRNIKEVFENFTSEHQFRLKNISPVDISFDEFEDLLLSAELAGSIDDRFDELALYGLENIRCTRIRFSDNFVKVPESKEKLEEYSEKILVSDTLVPELERIYSVNASEFEGHPVHYIVSYSDLDTRRETCRTLLSALYANGRIKNRRYSFCDIAPDSRVNEKAYTDLYKLNENGTVVVRMQDGGDDDFDDFETAGSSAVETLCSTAVKFRRSVLTVFCLPTRIPASKREFLQNLAGLSVIEIKENSSDRSRAVAFLKGLASESGLEADEKLLSGIGNGGDVFYPKDLKKIFARWYDEKLRTEIYPQYGDECLARAEVRKSAAKGKAVDELNRMIGLEKAKEVIETAVNYYKLQKKIYSDGEKIMPPAMHMVFTGNPGTAKTTVARLFAGIMRENGLLSVGKLFEVGRADLVGKYVGWTADNIKKKFCEARGSVLFIDEAYSLVDGSHSFGDEAINTIVQEMENARADTVVIFAGYPKEMEEFLQKNPGLRSRIAFHVPFDDYGTKDLVSIAELIAEKRGSRFSDEAKEKLATVFEEARRTSDFGNGRYARNIVEKAEMHRANRLMKKGADAATLHDMRLLTAEDIPVLKDQSPESRPRPIGFCRWSSDGESEKAFGNGRESA